MSISDEYDAVVVGAGPNGLAAAIAIAQAGKSVAVFEANETAGGAVRSAALTLSDFVHDICSAVYPLALGSPFFRTLPLEQYGVEWIQPPAPLAHPFDDGTALLIDRSVEKTAARLDSDAGAYRRLFAFLSADWDSLSSDLLAPPRWPSRPIKLARFATSALQPARRFAEKHFDHDRTKALFGGLAAHSMLPLEQWGSAAFGLVLGATAHALGWPIVRGGAQRLADALCSYLVTLGAKVFLNHPVRTLAELPQSRAVLCDLTPRQLLEIAGPKLPSWYRDKLKNYRYGCFQNRLGTLRSSSVARARVQRGRHRASWRKSRGNRALGAHGLARISHG